MLDLSSARGYNVTHFSAMLWFLTFIHKTVGTVVQDVLLEIRAGKMIANGTRVTPDPRKGLIRLVKVGSHWILS